MHLVFHPSKYKYTFSAHLIQTSSVRPRWIKLLVVDNQLWEKERRAEETRATTGVEGYDTSEDIWTLPDSFHRGTLPNLSPVTYATVTLS